MSNHNGETPAFPQPMAAMPDGTMYVTAEKHCDWAGLSKREEFAKAALIGILAGRSEDFSEVLCAKSAIECADALLAALAQHPNNQG